MEKTRTSKLWKRILSFALAIAVVLSGMTIVPNEQSTVQAAETTVASMTYFSGNDGPVISASGVENASYGFVMPKFFDANGAEIAYSDVASDLSVKVNVDGVYTDIDSVPEFQYNVNWGHWADGGVNGYWFMVSETTELQLYMKSNESVTLDYTLQFTQLGTETISSITASKSQVELDATGGGGYGWEFLTVNGKNLGSLSGQLSYAQVEDDMDILVDNNDDKGFVALLGNAESGFIWDQNFGIYTDGNGGLWFSNIDHSFTVRFQKKNDATIYTDVQFIYKEVDRTQSDCTLTSYDGKTAYDANAAEDNSGSIGIPLPLIGGTKAVKSDLENFVYQIYYNNEWVSLSETTTGWVYQGNGYSKYSTKQQWGYWVDTIYGLWFQPVLADVQLRIGYPKDGTLDSDDLNTEIGNNWVTYTFTGNPNATIPDPAEFIPIEVDNEGEPSGDVTSVTAPEGWKLIWNDEFNGNSVDDSKWTNQTGFLLDENDITTAGWGNNEVEHYTDSPENTSVADGKLKFTMRKDPKTFYDTQGRSAEALYSSGKLISQNKFSVKYGRVDFRAKLPDGVGVWPALWMMPNDDIYGTWAASGEIDVFEGIGRTPEMALGTLHYGGQWPDNHHTGDTINMVAHEDIGSDMTNWHVYSVVWEEGKIKIYADGICYYMCTPDIWYSNGANGNRNAPFDQRFYLIMNLAAGGWFDGGRLPDFDTFTTKEMYVDYVRVYQKEVADSEDEKPDSVELEESGATKGNISVGKDDNLYGDYHIGAVVNATGISLNKASTTIEAGNTEKLTVNFEPANATNKNVTWSSSDETVATVAGGTVTALKAGTTTITATSADGGFKATCEVTVTGVAPEKFTVTFDSDGGSAVTAQTITKGQTATEPSAPTKSGYTFAGWYNGDEAYDFSTAVNANITLTAKWTENSSEGGGNEGGGNEGGGNEGGSGEISTTRGVIYDEAAKTLTFRVADAADGVREVKCAFQTYATKEEAQTRAEDKTDAGMPAYMLTKKDDGTWEYVIENYTPNNSYVLYAFYFAGGSEEGLGEWTVASFEDLKATPEDSTVAVTGVSLNQTTLSLEKGDTATLTATVAPTDATDKSVTWSSSDDTIASVTNGTVTAKKAGTATITVTTTDGSKKATCTVTVTESEEDTTVAVTNVTLNKTSLVLEEGATETLTATVSPSNATDKNVTWSTSKSSVATVENGVVTAKGVGTATITATAGNKTATCTVNVTAKEVEVTGVTLNTTSLALKVGGTSTLTASVAPTNATNQNVTWSSSDSSVAMVDTTGKVTAVAAGTAMITVTTADGNKTATCTVTVTEPTADEVAVESVSLNKETLELTEGDEETLTATVTPDDATDASVTWSTSAPEVATVVNGKVTAVGAGTATITVTTTDGGKTATCEVTVNAPVVAVNGVSLNKSSVSLTVGGTQNLTATVTPTNATNKNVTWRSSEETVARVDANGKVTALKEGTATIIVTTEDGAKTATCTVVVTEKQSDTGTGDTEAGDNGNTGDNGSTGTEDKQTAVTGVALNKTALSLTEGGSETLTATVSPSTATNKAVAWFSSDNNVATVDANGKVIAKKAGTATISVMTVEGQKTATCTVTVTANNGAVTPPTTTPATPAPEGSKPEAEANKTVTETNTDKGDVAGSSFIKLRVKATGKNKQVKLSWKKVSGADGYIVYGSQCGKSLEKLTSTTKKSYTHKGLKKGKYYKYVVAAYKVVDGQNYIIETSTSVHAATTGSKFGNPTKVTVKPAKATIKKGKTKKLKATYKASTKKVTTHIAKFRYESSNPEIATVNKKGVVKGVSKGKATIYVYTQNGIYKTVKITVK